jgi:predicted nucleic acid-binding protein
VHEARGKGFARICRLQSMPEACIVMRWRADLLQEAWSLRHNVSAYDAFYIVAARLYDAQVLTADGPLARTPHVGIVIENVRL